MIFGDHGRIRTLNLLIRSQVLYPVELRSQIVAIYNLFDPDEK